MAGCTTHFGGGLHPLTHLPLLAMPTWLRSLAAAMCFVTVSLALASCSSGKPSYCSQLTTLQGSVNQLTNLSPSSSVSKLKDQVNTIKSDASAVVASAKSD